MLASLEYFHPEVPDAASILALAIAEELVVKRLINPHGFTFWDAHAICMTLPSGYGRVITRSVTRHWLQYILEILCSLEILRFKHGVYCFVQENWNDVLRRSYSKRKLAEMDCSSTLN